MTTKTKRPLVTKKRAIKKWPVPVKKRGVKDLKKRSDRRLTGSS